MIYLPGVDVGNIGRGGRRLLRMVADLLLQRNNGKRSGKVMITKTTFTI